MLLVSSNARVTLAPLANPMSCEASIDNKALYHFRPSTAVTAKASYTIIEVDVEKVNRSQELT